MRANPRHRASKLVDREDASNMSHERKTGFIATENKDGLHVCVYSSNGRKSPGTDIWIPWTIIIIFTSIPERCKETMCFMYTLLVLINNMLGKYDIYLF